MTTENVMAIATAAAAAGLDAVFEAAGRGPGNFTGAREVIGLNDADGAAVTHYANFDPAMDAGFAAELRALAASQDLPNIAPNQWGEDDVITSLAAQTAAEGLQVVTHAGDLGMTNPEWADAQLATLDLRFKPSGIVI